MATIKLTHPWFLAMFAIVVVGGAVTLRFATTANSMSMVDVRRIVQANGFMTYAAENEVSGKDAICLRMIVSRRELSDEEANSLAMSNLEDPKWTGCICVIHVRREKGSLHLWPVPEDVYGNFCLFGDRKLVRTVKSLLASGKRRD